MDKDYKYRFIAYMDIPRQKGCITYLGGISKNGYGVFAIDRKSHAAHRIAYELFVGRIPKNKMVLHTCDNRKCVAPKHLFIGTHSENMKDMYKKERHHANRGEKHGMAKLTKLQVEDIRRKIKEGVKRKLIAETYGISTATVSDIKYKKSWK
jgi:Autographiviridae endonuclease